MIGPSTSSGEKSADAQVTSRASFLHGFELNPPNAGFTTIKIYDSENSTLTGKLLIATATCSTGMNSIYLIFPSPKVANRGIYADITSTPGSSSTTYNVAFSLG